MNVHICFAHLDRLLELLGADGRGALKLPFQEAAIFMHLVNLNEKLPGHELSTLADQHNARKAVSANFSVCLCVLICMCVCSED